GYLAPVTEIAQKLDQLAKKLTGLSLPAGKVLLNESGSRQGAVDCLIKFARTREVKAIALSSHGRAGLDRFVMGSFAENMLRDSEWPVYFFSGAPAQSMVSHCEPGRYFFATDFSDHSLRAFKAFLAERPWPGEHLTIFHAVVFPAINTAMGATYIPENYFTDQVAWARRMGEEWLKEAKGSGFAAEVVVKDECVGVMKGNSILEAASKAKTEIIVMASASGQVGRLIFGSAAYEVFRTRKFPVLLYGPNALKEAAAKSHTEKKDLDIEETKLA
ncbi:MAG: universal stress protein, partial [Bdellovibrionota bacterium]